MSSGILQAQSPYEELLTGYEVSKFSTDASHLSDIGKRDLVRRLEMTILSFTMSLPGPLSGNALRRFTAH